MKKVLLALLAMLFMAGALAACTEAPAEPEDATTEYVTQTEGPAPEDTPEFTLQQIEEALTPQLDFGHLRPIDWEVVAAERIGVNPEGTMVPFEPGGIDVDISGSVRYRVTVQWAEEPNDPEALYVWDHGAMNRQAEQFFIDNPDHPGGVGMGEGEPLDIIWMPNPLLGSTEVREWDFFIREDGAPELTLVFC